MTVDIPPDVEELFDESVNRADALATLRNGPRDRAELMADLGLSRTTIHRVIRSLDDLELLAKRGQSFELTRYGRVVASEVETLERNVHTAYRLKPFLESIDDVEVDFDIELFTDATVTNASRQDPYAPVRRFMELLGRSQTLRGFDTTTISPVYVEDIRDRILGGMDTEIIYLPETAEAIASSHPEAYDSAVESGRLTLLTDDDLPFGLALFDDRVGLGGYDSETGLLRTFVDTDAPDAYAWGEALFESYRERADVFSDGSTETA